MKLLHKSQVIDVDTLEPKTIEIWARYLDADNPPNFWVGDSWRGGWVMFALKPNTQFEFDFQG